MARCFGFAKLQAINQTAATYEHRFQEVVATRRFLFCLVRVLNTTPTVHCGLPSEAPVRQSLVWKPDAPVRVALTLFGDVREKLQQSAEMALWNLEDVDNSRHNSQRVEATRSSRSA